MSAEWKVRQLTDLTYPISAPEEIVEGKHLRYFLLDQWHSKFKKKHGKGNYNNLPQYSLFPEYKYVKSTPFDQKHFQN